MTFTPRVFSGIKPSGDLHLGNYLGAIRRFVPLQDTHETIYCVVDMHAITVWQEPENLKRWTYEIAAAYIAAGVDPKRSIIFNQSQVMEHAELSWIFNCVARMGWMERMTQFKDKSGENAENVSLGLLADRYASGLVEQDIGRHQRGIGKQPQRDVLGVFAGLVLELGHPLHPPHAGDAVEDPAQLGMFHYL